MFSSQTISSHTDLLANFQNEYKKLATNSPGGKVRGRKKNALSDSERQTGN